MTMHTKVSGTWRETDTNSVKVSGTWREADVYAKYSNSWREIYRNFSASPSEIGIFIEGGYFAGIIDTTLRYALIVAPKAQGESPDKLTWKTTRTSTSGTGSKWDGWTNSNNMNNTSHPAARYCRTLNINGYDDWYLPAKDELELLYRHFKPTTDSNYTGDGENNSSDPTTNNYTFSNPSQTTISAFLNEEKFTASHYWSSSEVDSTGSWYQYFSAGYQDTRNKSNSYNVRAVRRLIL